MSDRKLVYGLLLAVIILSLVVLHDHFPELSEYAENWDWKEIFRERVPENSGYGATVEPGHFNKNDEWIPDGPAEPIPRRVTFGNESGEEAAERINKERGYDTEE